MKSIDHTRSKQTALGIGSFIIAAILIYLLWGDARGLTAPPLTPILIFWLLVSGLIAGVFGSLIGVGGGVILLPILHFSLGYPSPWR